MYRFIALLAPAVLLMGLGLDLYLPSEHIIMDALNLNFPQVQLTLSLYMYSFGIGQLFMGPIVDTWGRRIPLVFSLLIYIIGSLLIAQTELFTTLLWGRCLQAFGACGAMVCSFALVRDRYDGKEATTAFTYINGISALAPILAPTIGAYLATHLGWRSDFYFLAIFGFMAILGSFFIDYPPSDLNKRQRLDIKNYFKILKNPIFFYYACAAGLIQAVMFGSFSCSPVVYLKLLGLNELQFAILFSLNAGVFLIVAFCCAKWIAKIGINKSIIIGSGAFCVAGLLMFAMHACIGMHIFTLLIPGMLASGGCALGLGAACSGALEPFKLQSGKAAALLGCIEFMLGGFLGSLVVFFPMKNTLPFGVCLISSGIAMFVCMQQVHKLKNNALVKRT